MAQIFRITREGAFKTEGSCPTQCRDPGWTDYRFLVTIEARKTPTPEGWIIDNRWLRDYWASDEAKKPASCEGLASRALSYFRKCCDEVGTEPSRVLVRVYAENSYVEAEYVND